MKKTSILVSLLLLTNPVLPAGDSHPSVWGRFGQPYTEQPIPPVDLTNSPRIGQLLRAGNIYLSLSDAIALAIENNLDIELQRYNLPTADAELLRAKGGGLLRGISYNLAEVPVGVGGPASPLVTSVASQTFGVGSVPTNPSELGVLTELVARNVSPKKASKVILDLMARGATSAQLTAMNTAVQSDVAAGLTPEAALDRHGRGIMSLLPPPPAVSGANGRPR